MLEFERQGDELSDREYPDDDPRDDDDNTDTVACAACGAEVYEDAEQCPVCGEYITQFHGPLSGRSLAFVILGILGILASVYVMVVGF